jgi:1,4-dihydroxy-2-naphthoate octaprenyltransferase
MTMQTQVPENDEKPDGLFVKIMVPFIIIVLGMVAAWSADQAQILVGNLCIIIGAIWAVVAVRRHYRR